MSESNNQNKFIDSHIKYIRRMALLTDDQLKFLLQAKLFQDNTILDKFKDSESKKQFNELSLMAKDIKTESLKLARKVA